MSSEPFILGIESSCDDTAACVMKGGKLLANRVADQSVHQEFGGVVPELASRAHQRNIVPVVEAVTREAGIGLQELDAVAYTRGPGLMGSLLVGSSFARSLAWSLGIPLIGVNHMRGHILSHFIRDDEREEAPIDFPYLNLTVSGGHTELVLVESPYVMKVVGRTLDDAAGEAFDKTAKMLGLPYPGGPHVDRLARKGSPELSFSRPDIPGLDMSFSGLKTSILYTLQGKKRAEEDYVEQHLADICASVQRDIVGILEAKMRSALKLYPVKNIAVAGGVAANSAVRDMMVALASEHELQHSIPPMRYCTDNAAMIAMVGHYDFVAERFSALDEASSARLDLQEGLNPS